MQKFVFRLQKYLDIKEKLEDQKKLAYGQAVAELERQRQMKLAMENQRRSNISQLKRIVSERVDPLDIQQYNNFIDVMKKRIAQQEIVVTNHQQIAEEKRRELVEAMQQRKMLDTLKDNAREGYNRQEVIAEQKTVDEVVSFRYGAGIEIGDRRLEIGENP